MGIEVVWGVASVPALPVQTNTLNFGHAKHARAGELLRVPLRPSQVKRIGHAVISTPDVEGSVAWAHRHLGIIRSDDVHAEDDPDTLLASFNRIDDGEGYVDHHVMMFGRHQSHGLNHVSFEVQDIDDLAIGHELAQAEASGPPCLGSRAAHPGQPDLRLLEGPVGAPARALDGFGRAELQQRLSPASQKPGPAIAVGAAGATGIPRRRQPVAASPPRGEATRP